MMGFIIRKAIEQDIQQIQQVAKTSWNDTYENIIPMEIQENFLQSAYSDDMMVRRLETSLLLVAEQDNKVIGFANFSPVKDKQSELAAIYLYPSYKAKGIGTALLQKGICHLENVNMISVHVEKDNEVGMNFYKAKGFKKSSEFEEMLFGYTLKTIKMILNLYS